MNNSYAKVILDSVGPNGKRLISVEARYWRAIHAEVMTHRDRARNAASSRAIPFLRYKDVASANFVGIPVDNCTYSYIKNDPFMPEFMGTEQKGMQSGGELVEPNRGNCLQAIEEMRDFCLVKCKYLFEQGLHKSIINRYLEPWSYITVIMTATEWNNFFRLRVHPKAEKHFNKVAGQIKAAIEASTPQVLKAGEWHMPYLQVGDWDSVGLEILKHQRTGDGIPIIKGFNELTPLKRLISETLKRISAARCGRLSYLTQDGVRDYNKDLGLFEALIHPKLEADRDDDVIHSSPLEHVAEASGEKNFRSGPFNGWFQFRKQFPNENVEG